MIWLSWLWDAGQCPWVLRVLGRGVGKVQGCMMVAGGFLQTLEVIQSADHEIQSKPLTFILWLARFRQLTFAWIALTHLCLALLLLGIRPFVALGQL